MNERLGRLDRVRYFNRTREPISAGPPCRFERKEWSERIRTCFSKPPGSKDLTLAPSTASHEVVCDHIASTGVVLREVWRGTNGEK